MNDEIMLNEGVELSRNFITDAIDEDLASGRFNKIITLLREIWVSPVFNGHNPQAEKIMGQAVGFVPPYKL